MVPVVRPGLVAGSVLVFISTLGAFVVPEVLGGAKSSYLGNVIRDQFHNAPLDYPLGSARTVALLACVAAAMAVHLRFAREPGTGARP